MSSFANVTFHACKNGILHDDFNTRDFWLIQQENCARSTPKGLSAAVKDKYSYGCVLNRPTTERRPGQIIVCKPPDGGMYGGPIIVNFLAQKFPGRPGRAILDNARYRQAYFLNCLNLLKEEIKKCTETDRPTVVFPDHVGCTLAGGDWKVYRKMILDWATEVENVCDVKIVKLTM